MADKLKLSGAHAERLASLSNRLNLRRNVICRMAIGWSLAQNDPVPTTISTDMNGFEFNKPTVLGSDEYVFAAICAAQSNKPIDDSIFFNVVIKNHIERGLDGMFNQYQRINSPVEFMESMLTIRSKTDVLASHNNDHER